MMWRNATLEDIIIICCGVKPGQLILLIIIDKLVIIRS